MITNILYDVVVYKVVKDVIKKQLRKVKKHIIFLYNRLYTKKKFVRI